MELLTAEHLTLLRPELERRLDEQKAQKLQERRDAASRLDALRLEQSAALAKQTPVTAKARAELDTANARQTAAQAAYNEAWTREQGLRQSYATRISREESIIRSGANHERINRFRDEVRQLLSTSLERLESNWVRDLVSWIPFSWSNEDDVKRRQAVLCHILREGIEELRLFVGSDAELEARIEQLRSEIPGVNRLEPPANLPTHWTQPGAEPVERVSTEKRRRASA